MNIAKLLRLCKLFGIKASLPEESRSGTGARLPVLSGTEARLPDEAGLAPLGLVSSLRSLRACGLRFPAEITLRACYLVLSGLALILALVLSDVAESASQSIKYDHQNKVTIITMNWTAGANGAVPPMTTNWLIDGYVLMVVTAPGTPAPTDGYNVVLADEDGVDVAGGSLMKRSSTVSEQVDVVRYVTGKLSLRVSGNTVAGAKGKVVIYIYREK